MWPQRATLLTLTWLAIMAVPAVGQITADDFLPPSQGGTTKIKFPEKVRTEKGVVVAATAQDAINTAAQENQKAVTRRNAMETGILMVKFPSGLGYVATGAASYRKMDNPTATRISQRKAYVIAYTEAKTKLAQYLDNLDSEGKETVRASLQNINLPKEEMTNIATRSEESVKQAVEMMLAGFVVYEVKDDPTQQLVTVSIVSTSKTRSRVARPAPNAIETDNLREGLNQVIQEVRTGIVPPVGGRIILVRSTGETVLVGFGSAVVGGSQNTAVQAKLNLTAQKIAQMRSQDALCGLLTGDQISWKGKVVDSHKEEVKEFEELTTKDPLAQGASGPRKLEKARQTFLTELKTDDVYTSARKGRLPPGVIIRSWFDDDHAWAYAMSVYVPSASKAAAEAAREMRNSIFPGKVPAEGKVGDSSGFTDEKNPNVKRPGSTVKPGPTGKIGNDGNK